MKRVQRTFEEHEDNVYAWIDHMRRAHDVWKVVIVQRFKKRIEQYSWQVKVHYR
jgi:hypothetical protein